MTLPSIPAPVLAAFVVASLVLAATPGPGVLYIVTRALAQGRRAGLASVAGVALGNFGNALGASLGLAALLAVSARAFDVVRFAGAAYLMFLGIRALRAAPLPRGLALPATLPVSHLLRDGFIVALLNPKTALFFAAFLPQFIDRAAPELHSVLFGAAFVAIAACTDTAYVLAAGAVAPVLRGRAGIGRLGRRAAAVVYIGLGVFAAVFGARGTP